MKHILDKRTGVIHYEWTKDNDELNTRPTPYCCEDIMDKNGFVSIGDTDKDVDCVCCLHDVAIHTDRTYHKGDLVLYDGMYCLVHDIDPTYALIQYECQDGSFSWDIPDDDIKRINKNNKPPLFWRMKRTPYKGRMKFWIGRNFGNTQGAFIIGEVHKYNGMTEADAIIECRHMLEGYVNQWRK